MSDGGWKRKKKDERGIEGKEGAGRQDVKVENGKKRKIGWKQVEDRSGVTKKKSEEEEEEE